MRVLVTGGAGFIGSTIVDQLVARGDDVIVVDRLHPVSHHDKPTYLNGGAEYHFADLTDPSVAGTVVEGVEAVCHQAAMVGLGVDFADAPGYVDDNDVATAVLLRALHDRRFTGRVVLASSMVVYGEGAYACTMCGSVRPEARQPAQLDGGLFEPDCPVCGRPLTAKPVDETAATDPRNVYAATKLHQEHLCAAFAREHDASLIGLRYHNVYGPRMPKDTPYAGVAAIFRSALERGEPPRVFEDGGQRRDFIHVADVARANLLALDVSREPGSVEMLNIATGSPHTVLELAETLTTSLARPDLSPRVVGGYRIGDVRHVFASPARAADRLAFRAAITFDAGIAEFARAELRA